MKDSLYDFYKHLKKQKIMFCYCGPIAQSGIEGIGNTLRKNLEIDKAGNATSLAVFSVFIEQVQNILYYSADKISDNSQGEELRAGIVVIGNEENNDYFVCCGNKIKNNQIEKITSYINDIKDLGKDKLKDLYKERRRKELEPGAKGAGLGLIEMARKSKFPISFGFDIVDEEYSFFHIKVIVGR